MHGRVSDVIAGRPRARALALAAAALTALAVARVALTYGVFSHTIDEPAHLAVGLEKLTFGRYRYELHHPPIARLAVALGPYLAGVRSTGHPNMWTEGWRDLTAGHAYERNLALARAGVLPFLVALCALVWWWTRRAEGDDAAATLSVLCLTSVPPVLAHAGLATTDVPFTATLAGAGLALVHWLDAPRRLGRAALLGAAGGISLCTKFSFAPYFGIGAALVAVAWGVAWWRGGGRPPDGAAKALVPPVLLAGAVAFAVCFVVYDFDVGRIRGIPLPLPDLLRGMREVAVHNLEGHLRYLLGETGTTGRLAFFPIALAVKTPIAFLILAIIGLGLAVRRWWSACDPRALAPYLFAAAILAVAMAANVNLGLRHVLPMFAFLSVGAAGTLVAMWRQRRARILLRGAAAMLVAWMIVDAARAHPDYLAWFNPLAGREPAKLLVDSDLDWGQDVDRLADTLRARDITSVSAALFARGERLEQLVPEVRRMKLGDRPRGWVAISESLYRRGAARYEKGKWTLFVDEYAWLREHEPVAIAGKSIRLYFIP